MTAEFETKPTTDTCDEGDGHCNSRLDDEAKAAVDEWLAGIDATREGIFTEFYIMFSEESGIRVTPDNADEVEAHIRTEVSPFYPEIAVQVSEG